MKTIFKLCLAAMLAVTLSVAAAPNAHAGRIVLMAAGMLHPDGVGESPDYIVNDSSVVSQTITGNLTITQDFPTGADTYGYYTFVWPADAPANINATNVDAYWFYTGTHSGNVCWQTAVATAGSGSQFDTGLINSSYARTNANTNQSALGSAGLIRITNSTGFGSLGITSGNLVSVRVMRAGGTTGLCSSDDTFNGDAKLVAVVINY